MAEKNFISFEILSICKGGGYRYCRTNPPHPRRNTKGLYPLHRVLMENKLGRLLESWEIVHHKDENKANDNPENLELLNSSEHARHHRQEKEVIHFLCSTCGKQLSLKPHQYRLRIKRNVTGKLFCSRSCGTIAQHKRVHNL